MLSPNAQSQLGLERKSLLELKKERVQQNKYMKMKKNNSLCQLNKRQLNDLEWDKEYGQKLIDQIVYDRSKRAVQKKMSRIGEQIISNEQQQTAKTKDQVANIISRSRSTKQLVDKSNMNQQDCIINTNESQQSKDQEEEFLKFIQQNPSLNYFIKKQMKNVDDDSAGVKERLLKYFYDNIGYFKHIAGKCECFEQDCGQQKCKFIHKKINDNYGTIYRNTMNNGGNSLQKIKYYNHNLEGSRQSSLDDSATIEDKQQSNENNAILISSTNQQLYQSPRKNDYNKSVHISQQISKEPQLCNMSSYHANYYPQKVQPKEIHLVRNHNIVQNTRLIGNSVYRGEYHKFKGQEHFEKVEIRNPLTNRMHLPMKREEEMKMAKKRDMIYQVDNLEVIMLFVFQLMSQISSPIQFQTINQMDYQNPKRQLSNSKLK